MIWAYGFRSLTVWFFNPRKTRIGRSVENPADVVVVNELVDF